MRRVVFWGIVGGLIVAVVVLGAVCYRVRHNEVRLAEANMVLGLELNSTESRLRDCMESVDLLMSEYNREARRVEQLGKQIDGLYRELEESHSNCEILQLSNAELLADLEEVESKLAKFAMDVPPSEFASLHDLEVWLSQDLTDINLPNSWKFDCDDYTYMLTRNAWQAGYIICPYFTPDRRHAMCTTKIGNRVYLIEPQTDRVSLWGYLD